MKNNDYDGFSIQLFAKDDKCLAKFIELEDIIAEGSDLNEALQNLKQVWDSYKEELTKAGKEIPDSTLLKKYSGTFYIRTTPDLHRAYAIEAQIQGKSLNKLIEESLAKELKRIKR